MARENVHVDLGNLQQRFKYRLGTEEYDINPGQILLRADDALYSTLGPYRENALDWWHWLDPKHISPAINAIRNFLNTCEQTKAKLYKQNIGTIFKKMGCDGIDGAFYSITDTNGNLLDVVSDYNRNICNFMGMQLDLPKHYVQHTGKYKIDTRRVGYDMKILEQKNLYSYAFIFGPRSMYDNFSYTIDMVD
jgi:hypothetical protein